MKSITLQSFTRSMAGLLVILALVGCAAPAGRPATRATSAGPDAAAPVGDSEQTSTSFDPCAARMHDLAGLLLLHFMRDGELPTRLSDLGPALSGMPVPPLVCPVSNQPYTYNPVGIYLPERRAHLVLYDSTPAHDGYRWCIIAQDDSTDASPVFKVIALPESFFVLHPPNVGK